MNRKWSERGGAWGNVIKLLIIDDDPVMTAVYGKCFQDAKFNVEIANDGVAGQVLLRTFNPDIVLLDLSMPGPDGMEWLRRVRSDAQYKQIPVLFLTALSPDSPQVQAAMASDAVGVLFKSEWNPETVLAAVNWAASVRRPAAAA